MIRIRCRKCGQVFTPSHGRQELCAKCRPAWQNARSAARAARRATKTQADLTNSPPAPVLVGKTPGQREVDQGKPRFRLLVAAHACEGKLRCDCADFAGPPPPPFISHACLNPGVPQSASVSHDHPRHPYEGDRSDPSGYCVSKACQCRCHQTEEET